jgi:hypothetical protein
MPGAGSMGAQVVPRKVPYFRLKMGIVEPKIPSMPRDVQRHKGFHSLPDGLFE